MRSLIILSLLCVLSSCFSYKSVSENDSEKLFDSNKTYTLALTNKTKVDVKHLRVEGENYFYTYKNKEKTVPISAVKKVSEKKFSWEKTIGLAVGISVLTFVVVEDSLNNMSFTQQ